MKIEKLTDNKIRVIVSSSDLGIKKVDINLLMSKALEGQNFLSDILEQAKKEVDFDTSGCKLLIETFSLSDGILIFTITKYSINNSYPTVTPLKKRVITKRKNFTVSSKHVICKFKNFDEFCDFCNYIYSFKHFDIKQFSTDISLYLYNDTYYLVIKNINNNYENIETFYYIVSECSIYKSFSSGFENKLIEHGKLIINKSAIETTLKYFCS